MKPISQLLQIEDLDMASITHFPFQAQITYTALNGDKCLRVITQTLERSSEREELTRQADAEMIQQNVLMQGAKNARAGKFREAQAIMKTYQRAAKKQGGGGGGGGGADWEANRADFSLQAKEVYSNMNQMVASKKMSMKYSMPDPM